MLRRHRGYDGEAFFFYLATPRPLNLTTHSSLLSSLSLPQPAVRDRTLVEPSLVDTSTPSNHSLSSSVFADLESRPFHTTRIPHDFIHHHAGLQQTRLRRRPGRRRQRPAPPVPQPPPTQRHHHHRHHLRHPGPHHHELRPHRHRLPRREHVRGGGHQHRRPLHHRLPHRRGPVHLERGRRLCRRRIVRQLFCRRCFVDR